MHIACLFTKFIRKDKYWIFKPIEHSWLPLIPAVPLTKYCKYAKKLSDLIRNSFSRKKFKKLLAITNDEIL